MRNTVATLESRGFGCFASFSNSSLVVRDSVKSKKILAPRILQIRGLIGRFVLRRFEGFVLLLFSSYYLCSTIQKNVENVSLCFVCMLTIINY
jgi:hypothetical protein